jgi:ADP-ribose pyrophosphatase
MVIDSVKPYEGPVVTLQVDKLSRGDGITFSREIAVVVDAVAIAAVDEQDRILLIKQYRHAMKGPVWEIPAGRMDEEGETPEQTAIRELNEEADTNAEQIELLTVFSNSVGWTCEKTHVFSARGLESTPQFNRQNEEADIEKKWINLSEASKLVQEGIIIDAKTIIAILLLCQQ